MEVYHGYVLDLPGIKGSSCCWSWSKARTHQPLLAAPANGNAVSILSAQGVPWAPVKGTVRNVRGTEAACLSWHPTLPLLAIGWRDGAISLWDAAHRRLAEDSKVHRQPISHIVWGESSSHLLTADLQGKVALWEIDQQQQPQCKSSVTEKAGSIISHLIWGAGTDNPAADVPAGCTAYFVVSTPDSSTVTINWLNEQGQTGIVQDVGEALLTLLYYPEQQQLVAVTTSGSAVILGSNSDSKKSQAVQKAGEWSTLVKMKFAGTGSGAKLQVSWAGPHTLATATTSDSTVRLLQLDTDDNYALDLNKADFARTDSAHKSQTNTLAGGIAALAYEPYQQMLAAVSMQGLVCLYKRVAVNQHGDGLVDLATQWEPQQSIKVGIEPLGICWGPTAQLLAVQCADGLHVCTRTMLQQKLSEGYAVMQEGVDCVVLEKLQGTTAPLSLVNLKLKIAGLDVTTGALLVHDGTKAQVYRIAEDDNSLSLLSEFEALPLTASTEGFASSAGGPGGGNVVSVTAGDAGGCSMALYSDSVYRTARGRVEVCSLSGVVKQTLAFDESQGQPVLLTAQSGYLAVLTSKALVRIFRLAGREAKPHAGPGPLLPSDAAGDLQISSLSMNCNGSLMSAVATVPSSGGHYDSRLFVYSSELNGPLMFDFAKDLQAPRAAHWDLNDPRLLTVQVVPLTQSQSRPNSGRPGNKTTAVTNSSALGAAVGSVDNSLSATCAVAPSRGLLVAIMFVSPEAGVLLQEYQDLEQAGASGFLGVAAPHLLVHKKALIGPPNLPSYSSNITRVPMLGFSGLENADAPTRQALLDFNYCLAIGKLEEAFRAVAALKIPAIWNSMAHMAIKNKRLDVAEHCLGNMQHVRGSRALRESHGLSELDARVGLVAVQLGLTDDAVRLFKGCERWDLVEQLHAAGGNWAWALDTAAKKDRIHLQSLHFAQARHLEATGDYTAAIQHYTASGAAATEVPRMLWQQGQLPGLEQHVMQSNDIGMLTWWARYCESQGRFDQALSCYQRAGNQLAALRVHCATGNWRAAEDVVATTQDPAAAFHLARIYEAQDKVDDALRCYSISKRYSHGARLAKRCGMDKELVALAMKSPKDVMLEAADYLLEAGNTEAAALLYQKGGHLGKALDMALASGLYDVLDSIAEVIDQDKSPELLSRCASAFTAAGRHDKAVHMLVHARQPELALDVLLKHDVALTEELAEALTPEKRPDNADSRSLMLMRIAQAAKRQGLYHLACKKYTQAGDRLKAMKALVKSGDTDKIVFFAGVSKQREVYIMAANYLQTLDWRSNPELLKTILSFYTKAGAADSLASFYMGCAQMEIDEYKAYEKALQAMQEAAKHLARSRASDRETQMMLFEQRCDRVSRFTTAQNMLTADPAGAVTILQQLLQEVDSSQDSIPDVRQGDIYGLLVEWCYQQGNIPQAMQLIQQMLDKGLIPQVYLAEGLVSEVCQASGVAVPSIPAQLQGTGAAAVDEVEDEVQQLPSIQDEEDYLSR